MNTLKHKANTFFKKDVVGTGFNVTPVFTDLGNGSDTTFTLSEGTSAQNAFILSGTVPEQPTYGAGDLQFGALRLFASDVNTKYNRDLPALVGYAMDKETVLKEGAFNFACSGNTSTNPVVGNYLSMYKITPFSDTPQLVEDFEGSPENLEVVNRMGANNIISYSDPYCTEQQIKDILERNGWTTNSRRMAYLDTLVKPYYSEGSFQMPTQINQIPTGNAGSAINLPTPQEYAQSMVGGEVHHVGEKRYPMKFVSGNTRRLRFKNSTAAGNGLFMQLGTTILDNGALKCQNTTFDVTRADYDYATTITAPSTVEGNAEADKGNTILSDFYATRNFSNPFDTTTDDPMITTSIELSAEKALNGGQSLRIYHNWGFAGPPSGTKNELIQNAIQESGNLNPQCARVSLYDIPYPTLPADAGGAKWAGGRFQSVNNLGDPRSVVPELRVGMNVTKLEPNVMLNLHDGDMFSSVDLIANQSTDTAGTDYSTTENTFLRSVVVTFSNYKPKKEHTSLDKFLYYGLQNFYTSGATENIVGGVVFTRFGIDGANIGTANNMFAYPLPVMKIMQTDNGGSPDTSNFTLANGGMGKLNGGSGLLTSAVDTLIWGSPAAVKPSSAAAVADNELAFVNLPMNSWFNMRCFFDIFQYNNSGSCTKRPYAPSGTNNPSDTQTPPRRGVPMRIIFDTDDSNNTQTVYNSAAGAGVKNVYLDGGSRVQKDTRNLPFLDVFFPAGDSSMVADLREYNWFENPEYYPKHMTVWVQNYCWVSGSATSQPWQFGDEDLYPEGCAREAEVFIDNIQLFNFEPTTQEINTTGLLDIKPQTHLSPIQKKYTSTGPKFGSGWVGGNPTTLTGSLKFTSGDASVSITDNQHFDTTFLDNHDTVTITASAFAGSKTINNITGRLTFEMNNNTGITSTTDIKAVLTCEGTMNPVSNRANLRQYDTGWQLALGWDSPDHLASTAPAIGAGGSGYTGYILANNFTTMAWDEVSDNYLYPDKLPEYISGVGGAIFSQQITGTTAGTAPPSGGASTDENYDYRLGGDMLVVGPSVEVQQHTDYINNISGAQFDVYSGTTAAVAGDQINLGISSGSPFASTNDFFSMDGFRQKGFMYVNISGSGTSTAGSGSQYPRTRWGSREHVGVSTKVTNFADTANSTTTGYEHMKQLNKNQIEVVDPSIFNFDNPNEKYVVYRMGATGTVSAGVGNDWVQGYMKRGLKLAEPPSGNIITFTADLFMSGDELRPLFLEEHLNQLYISPQKYWLTMLFDSDETNTTRSFESFCTINSVPSRAGDPASISGSTYSENQYSYNPGAITTGGASGLYTNDWDLIPIGTNPTLITNIDYGYGAMDAETNAGGYMLYGAIKPSNWNYYPLNAIANNYQVGDNIPVILYLDGVGGQERSATFFSDDYTTDTNKVPQIYWSFFDAPPFLSGLSVAPETNVVEGDTNLYDLTTETLNAVRFNWDEENADDIWYRYMFIDNKPINDKYHECTMRLPLNENTIEFSTAPTLKVYNPVANVSTNATVGSDVRQVLEGQGGYAPVLKHTANGKITIASAADYRGLEDLDEFSLVIHWTPAASDGGGKRYIVTQMDPTAYPGPTADALIMYKNTDDTITVTMGTGVSLTSVKAVTCDGETPTNIIMTYNSGSLNPNKANLYIDGTWQDGSTGQTRVQGDEDFVVGGYYGASQTGSAGMFEEILIYTKELHVIDTANEYIMPTVNVDDFYDAIGNTSLDKENMTHTARLFAADYHNFRGYNIRTQAMTNQTSWRTTTV